jgi:hypothetical protein
VSLNSKFSRENKAFCSTGDHPNKNFDCFSHVALACSSEHMLEIHVMSAENDALALRGRLAVTQALWGYERETILEALGRFEI